MADRTEKHGFAKQAYDKVSSKIFPQLCYYKYFWFCFYLFDYWIEKNILSHAINFYFDYKSFYS